jgi:hypothetical protein
VILAITAASTETHLLAWHFRNAARLEFVDYLRAAPWRAIAAVAVLAVDVALGLRWVDGGRRRNRAKIVSDRENLKEEAGGEVGANRETADAVIESAATAPKLLNQRDRSAMLARLFWQQWRQSWGLMAALSGLFILVTLVSFSTTGQWFWKGLVRERYSGPSADATYVPLALFAALSGCFVFRADQERRGFRYFLEHNVPARYVWLSRQVPWMAILFVCTVPISFYWLKFNSNVSALWEIFQLAMQQGWFSYDHYYRFLYVPPLNFGLACMAVSFGAGQFASMFVRSGIMAAFFGLLLAALLCGWVSLMHVMQVPFWWSVLPIPAVLLWATWQYAPRWSREDHRWSTLMRPASVIAVLTVALIVAVPFFRVHQVPNQPLRFNPEAYSSESSGNHSATDLYHQVEQAARDWSVLEGVPAAERQQRLVEHNQRIVELLVQATSRSDEHKTYRANRRGEEALPSEQEFVTLLLGTGREEQAADKWDEALDRYIAALKVVCNYVDEMLWSQYTEQLSDEVFDSIVQWGAAKGQTVARIKAAINRLKQADDAAFDFEGVVIDRYLIARRVLRGDQTAWSMFYPTNRPPNTGDILWNELMPWENDRAERVLNILTNVGFERLEQIRALLEAQALGTAKTDQSTDNGTAKFLAIWRGNWLDTRSGYLQIQPQDNVVLERSEWLTSTWPNFDTIGDAGQHAARQLIQFAARRRAAMISLALEGYRLQHGTLPATLADLTGEYFDVVPPDPFSGIQFTYFPKGIPQPRTELEQAELVDRQALNSNLKTGIPGIWCMGPELLLQFFQPSEKDSDESSPTKNGTGIPSYTWRRNGNYSSMLPTYTALKNGFWFPLPRSDGSESTP